MNEQEFEQITGHKPKDDDLERTNCPDEGKFGHWQCGVCEHGRPRFTCTNMNCLTKHYRK